MAKAKKAPTKNPLLTYAKLCDAIGNKLGQFDIPCPSCGPTHHATHTDKRRILRVWHNKPDFISFACARCGEEGYAVPETKKEEEAKPDPAKEQAEKKRSRGTGEARSRARSQQALARQQPLEAAAAGRRHHR